MSREVNNEFVERTTLWQLLPQRRVEHRDRTVHHRSSADWAETEISRAKTEQLYSFSIEFDGCDSVFQQEFNLSEVLKLTFFRVIWRVKVLISEVVETRHERLIKVERVKDFSELKPVFSRVALTQHCNNRSSAASCLAKVFDVKVERNFMWTFLC